MRCLCVAVLLWIAPPLFAGPPKASFNPSSLPPPRTSLPSMPGDGSGIYRLSLEGALGAAPLVVVLDIQAGKVVQAVSLPVHNVDAYCPTDASGLVLKGKTLAGTIHLEMVTPFSLSSPHSKHFHAKPNPKYAGPYTLKPSGTAAITINATCDGPRGEGEFAIKWSLGKDVPFGYAAKPSEKGKITLHREPSRPRPARFDLDLYLPRALGDSDLTVDPNNPALGIWMRLAMDQGVASKAFGYVALKTPGPGEELEWRQADVALKGSQISGRLVAGVKSRPKVAIELELSGHVAGRRAFGTVTSTIGDMKMATQWLGMVHDSGEWRLPMALPIHQWDWSHDAPADGELAAQALQESLEPVLPGEPGKAGFWTWRSLVRPGRATVIHPPSFDLQETKGAARYRFMINGVGSTTASKEFVADRPWRPLAPVWKDLAPGTYQLTVTPLDAAGQELAGPMQIAIVDKDARPAHLELKTIAFTKRPSFSGPYTKASGDWLEAAKAAARWHAEALGHPERRGHSISESGNAWTQGGDHGFGMCIAAQIWANLATRSLTTDDAERRFAEEMLAYNAEHVEAHQRFAKLPGSIYDYQANTPMMHWPGEAILDAYLQTGDPRWKAMALKLGEALVKLQNDNGSFSTTHSWPDKKMGPHGFFSWKVGYTEYPAHELLYLFGRIRRDCQTEAFVEAETKAYQWAMNLGVKERFFPLNLAHSASQGYPIWMHGNAALYLARYLLECAPPERQNLKLAEELARWAEDTSIHWQRAAEPKQTGQLTPRSERMDRYNNEPVANNLLAAIVFEELAQATGNKLWHAKGDALATAVLQGRDPRHGRLVTNLAPTTEDWIARQFHDASYRHGSFSSDWAIQMLREYAALRANRRG